MGNILVATALLWGLELLFVNPLAALFLRRGLREQPAFAEAGGTAAVDQSAATKCFILADVLVLTLAGTIAGLLGHWFIGFSWKAKAWPGLLAFIFSSLLAYSLRAAS